MNIDHLNGLIEMMEVMEFTLELYDSVWCFREMFKAENKRLFGLNKHLVDAEEDIRAKEGFSLDEGGLHALMYFGLMDIFPTCVDWILSKISEEKWASFYCLPNKQLEHGLKLIHIDNDVHSFFADTELNKEDAGLRCYSSSPFTTRIKKRGGNTKRKRKEVGRTLIDSCDKGKEKVDEFPATTPTKEHQVVAPVEENVDVGIKHDDRRRKIVFGSMAPANFLKNPVVSASIGQGSSVKGVFGQPISWSGDIHSLRSISKGFELEDELT
ncbi:hypothetical protein Tco_0156206 [Tanacetum coccineum]